MAVRIIKRQNGMYDIYRRDNGTWLQSYSSPDNVLTWLSAQICLNIDFIDETVKHTFEKESDPNA